MKINNNNLRAAKRHECGVYRGANGFSYRDFNLDRRLTDSNGHLLSKQLSNSVENAFSLDEFHQGLDVTKNRTHEKSENSAKEQKDDSPSAMP